MLMRHITPHHQAIFCWCDTSHLIIKLYFVDATHHTSSSSHILLMRHIIPHHQAIFCWCDTSYLIIKLYFVDINWKLIFIENWPCYNEPAPYHRPVDDPRDPVFACFMWTMLTFPYAVQSAYSVHVLVMLFVVNLLFLDEISSLQ